MKYAVNPFTRHIIIITIILIIGIPAIHKLSSDMPPEWFLAKFNGTWIDLFPKSISISFFIIVVLEILAPVFFIIGLVKKELSSDIFKFTHLGFKTTQILFVILTLGSFMVQDYDNGFKDFMYLFAIIILELITTSENKKLN